MKTFPKPVGIELTFKKTKNKETEFALKQDKYDNLFLKSVVRKSEENLLKCGYDSAKGSKTTEAVLIE